MRDRHTAQARGCGTWPNEVVMAETAEEGGVVQDEEGAPSGAVP